jgi:hypothetical protein
VSFEPEKVSTKDRLKELFHEGMVRHVVVRKEARSIVDLPLNLVILGTLLAPWLVGIGALIALLTGYRISMDRRDDTAAAPAPPPSSATSQTPPTSGAGAGSGLRQQPEVPGEQTFPDETAPPPTD